MDANLASACDDTPARDLPRTGACRVLHVVDESLPLVSGYAVRTNGITHAQMTLGNTPVVLTGPTHQFRDPTAKDIIIDGVSYVRTPAPTGLYRRAIQQRWPIVRELAIIKLFRRSISQALDSGEFDVVHAHSPVLNGLAALQAAHARRIPFVYEIRAFWEDAAVDQDKTTARSLRYLATRRLEQYVVEHADAIVGIARSILDELSRRGIERDNLFQVPNGVDAEKFQPIPRDEALCAKLGIGEVPVLGFIGSLFYFEGVSWLVRATAELRRRGGRFKLLIVGHGDDSDAIRKAIADNDAHNFVVFVGKVPHDQVRSYYSVADVMVYPRRSIRLTELVTPLKPLEAMAQGRTVLGSDVGGIRELVDDENTGLLFSPEDVDDFCRHASRLITDADLRNRLAQRAREVVLRQKTWTKSAARYDDVYEFARRAAADRSRRR
jgi:glycogen synthase